MGSGTHHNPFSSVITQVEKPVDRKEPTTPYTVKLRGAPFNVTEVCVHGRQDAERMVGGARVRRNRELEVGVEAAESHPGGEGQGGQAHCLKAREHRDGETVRVRVLGSPFKPQDREN